MPILEALYPAFGQVACLTRPSSSSGLYDARTGAPLPAGGGEHVYFVADDQSQHKAILHAFQRLAWTKGYGRLELSRNGATLIRGPVDVSVGSPERLIYEGAPELEHPIAQHPRHCTVRPGGMLDTQAFLAYADREAPQEMVDKLIGEAEAKDTFQARKAEVRHAWEQEYIAQRVSEGAEEVQARAEIAALDHQVLLGSAIFVTRSGARITVGEILFDPGKYEGEIGPDPIEGRGYGTTTARVMAARPGGAPVIFSFAHGGMIYALKHDVGSIEAGFESAFKAKGKSAQRAFVVAMGNAEITQIERTGLIKRAADFFGVGFNDLKRDIKTEKAAAETERKQSQRRKDGRFVLRYFPAEHARTVENSSRFISAP